MEQLTELFEKHFGHAPQKVIKLAGAGSSRRYYRLIDSDFSVIGTVGDNVAENEAFLAFDDYFKAKNLPVPQVIAVSDDMLRYLQEDLGDTSVYDVNHINGLPKPPESLELIGDSMRMLARFHAAGVQGFDHSKCFPRSVMDSRCVMWDLNYFKYCFLKLTGLNLDEQLLEEEFELIRNHVAVKCSTSFILRDFQSRNVMVTPRGLYLIDFQGAREGNPLYDVASFLWQARLALNEEQMWKFAEMYVGYAREFGVAVDNDWRESLKIIALFRLLQVLGAYGLRGLHERKESFRESIYPVLCRVSSLLDRGGDDKLPYLTSVIKNLTTDNRFSPEQHDKKTLTVTIYSFSFKKGIPDDFTGNGGGFVFDCRAVHNPGRYDEYKKLTGMDVPVIKFLEDDGEILTFMEHCYGLVDPSVERYLKRGFTNLMVSFGCTGGQHRSVYGAEAMARHLREKYDVEIRLIHREQGMERSFK